MRRYLAAAAIIITAVALNWVLDVDSVDGNTGQSTQVVYEDEPGWDCRTMGNQVCG